MSATDIELVFSTGCPHVGEARDNLRRALRDLGREPAWTEWNVDGGAAPDRVRSYASPAVLVGGVHVLGHPPLPQPAKACCASGAPSVGVIIRALEGLE